MYCNICHEKDNFKEVQVVEKDNGSERYVPAYACRRCGNIQMNKKDIE